MHQFLPAILLVVLMTSILMPSPAMGDDPVHDLLQAVRNARSNIEGGHFVAIGKFPRTEPDHRKRMEVWFSGNDWRVDMGPATHSAQATDSNTRRIIKRGSTCFLQSEGEIRLVTEKHAISEANYFDVRSLGLADSYDMKQAAPIEQKLGAFSESGIPIRVDYLTNGLVQLNRGPFPGGGRQVLTIDPFRGYVPMESRFFHGPGNEQLLQSTWEKIEEVWVPTRLKIRSRGILKVDFNLVWKSVNAIGEPTALDPRFVFRSGIESVPRDLTAR